MPAASSFSLFLSSKWKGTDVHDALSKIQFRIILEEDMNLLDFRTNSNGFCLIRSNTKEPASQPTISDYRKILAKVHNTYPNLRIQALAEASNKELYASLQDFASIELRIQIIPFENLTDMAQYVERSLMSECQDHLNQFTKEYIPPSSASDHVYLNCLKVIPKIGDKNAKIIAQKYKSLRALSKASYDELVATVGFNCAKSLYEFLNVSHQAAE